jgi:hypothetical protein
MQVRTGPQDKGVPDGSRYLGIISPERFLAVERYHQRRRPVAPAQPRRAPEPVGRSSAERPGTDRTPGKVR